MIDPIEHSLTEQQKTDLAHAIGAIIGEYTPYVLCIDTTPLDETEEGISNHVINPHTSIFHAIGLLYSELDALMD